MKKEFLYTIMCAFGGSLIGFTANKLSEVYGCILFAFGIFLIVFSTIKLNK